MLGRHIASLSAVALATVLVGASPALGQSVTKLSPLQSAAQPALTPSPSRVEFGAVGVLFGDSQRQSVQLAGSAGAPAQIVSVAIYGPDGSSFQVVDDGCSGQTIIAQGEPGPGAYDCSIELAYAPNAVSTQSATLEISYSADGESQTLEVPLSGVGVTGTLAADESPLSFAAIPYTGSGSHGEGEQNETEELTIRNGPGAGTQVEAVRIAGPDASSFSVQWGNCEHDQLGSNNTCSEGIRFQPISPGPQHAQLIIESDSSAGPLVVALEGEGLYGPHISLSSTQALLGEVAVGSFTSHTFTLTNTGDYSLGVQQAFLVSGTPLMFPVTSDTCSGQIVYPSVSCSVTVGFQPTTPGEHDASIVFITSNSLPVNVVGIDGVGVTAAATPQTSSQASTAPALAPSIAVAPLAPSAPKPASAPKPKSKPRPKSGSQSKSRAKASPVIGCSLTHACGWTPKLCLKSRRSPQGLHHHAQCAAARMQTARPE